MNQTTMTNDFNTRLGEAVKLARRGDLAGARTAGEALLGSGGDDGAVHAFLGMVAIHAGDRDRAARHLRGAHEARPEDITIALNLANTLLEGGAAADALAVTTAALAERDTSGRVLRLRAYLLQLTEDYAGAAEAYARIVAVSPGDFESWNNLGNARAATGDAQGSLEALERAVALSPDASPLRISLAATLFELGRFEDAAKSLEETAARFPKDVPPLLELANVRKRMRDDAGTVAALERAVALTPEDNALRLRLGNELALIWRMDDAEEQFRAVLAADPANRDLHSRMALLFEHTNRFGDLPALIAEAEANGVDPGAIAFSRALHLRREKKLEEGLAAVAQIADDVEPARAQQLAGQFHDLLGNTAAAFDAFSAMNQRVLAEVPEAPVIAKAYRDEVKHQRETATPEWLAGWATPPEGDVGREPVFLVGFPRSGTTLLDTLLMGDPKVQVLEERPPLNVAEKALGGFGAIATADADTLAAARAAYFEEAGRWIDLRGDSLLVDKFPLHMTKLPLIRRLFPHAKIILALRHPCDVVLSAFITNFRPNQGMSNFTDLASAAALYDLAFGAFCDARAALPLPVHEVRYESMVADGAAELKPLFDFLGLDWRDDVLDHQQRATDRGVIVTASYAQVTEPIYARAAGRWEKYREQLAPVLPVLEPWAERLGYAPLS